MNSVVIIIITIVPFCDQNKMMMMGGYGRGGGSSSSTRCQDCGNQAKRDCAYMRCRTCCKGKGFECQTHIKSTWLPSVGAQKHHHHLQTQTLLPHLLDDGDGEHLQLLPSASPVHQQNPRWLREIPSTGLQVGEEVNFPAEAILPAMLRCIRVRSMDDSTTQYAYQTEAHIGGHVFKGILYDQGLDYSSPATAGHFSGAGAAFSVAEPHQPNLSNAAQYHHHHQHRALIASASSSAMEDHDSHNIVVASSSSPSSCPLLPFSALMMPGMDFFQHSSSPKSP